MARFRHECNCDWQTNGGGRGSNFNAKRRLRWRSREEGETRGNGEVMLDIKSGLLQCLKGVGKANTYAYQPPAPLARPYVDRTLWITLPHR